MSKASPEQSSTENGNTEYYAALAKAKLGITAAFARATKRAPRFPLAILLALMVLSSDIWGEDNSSPDGGLKLRGSSCQNPVIPMVLKSLLFTL